MLRNSENSGKMKRKRAEKVWKGEREKWSMREIKLE